MEVVTSALAPGDSITAEPAQPVGDIDDFVVQGVAGTEVQVFVYDGGAFKLTAAMVPGTNTVVRPGPTSLPAGSPCRRVARSTSGCTSPAASPAP